jgi:succinate-semialdehyde dehydrogenase/glutarate-semialdehyde dehydrogenase
MAFISSNPATGKVLHTYRHLAIWSLNSKIKSAHQAFLQNRDTNLGNRIQRLKNLMELLNAHREECAALITLEVGKPITQSRFEIDRCIGLCQYYIDHSEHHLADLAILTENRKTVVQYAPLGVILGIMPWNFPFWQVFRFAIPAITAGNSVLLKHAPSVPQCALKIEDLFLQSGYPHFTYTNMFMGPVGVRRTLWDDAVQGVAVTGSVSAGSKIAELAGRYIKKSVLELGGNDPFIILADANLKEAVTTAIKSRFQNCGQSCIAAKRWIIEDAIYEPFMELAEKMIKELQLGDPRLEETEIGPMAGENHLNALDAQVKKSISRGAVCRLGGKIIKGQGYWYAPTLLTNVKKGMPAYDEELFGPVASIIKAKDADHAIDLANDSNYGLSASLWTVDYDKAERLAAKINTGNVFINTMSRSDPKLPFGGTKFSGYGRELGQEGIREFTNIKTLTIR